MKPLDNELKLIERAKQGDNDAIEQILNNYKWLVRKYAQGYYIVGGDKDDLIQEGIIGLFKAIKAYDAAVGSFAAFATVCINRNMMSAIKKSNRNKHKALNDALSLQNEEGELISIIANPYTDDPLNVILEKEAYNQLSQKINALLSPLERKVFSMYLEGDSYSIIAQKLGKNAKSIDNTLQRIRKKINALIEKA